MNHSEVLSRLKAVEPALRRRGVGHLYLFGSFSRDQATPDSDIDVFVDADTDAFYDLSNFMGVYEQLRDAFPNTAIGYSTREGLSRHVRPLIEEEAVRVF